MGVKAELVKGVSEAAKRIRAYHGTPHTFSPTPENPLGAFDLSKIGTGEGAQAYGHGIYLAEAKDTAKGYREDLSQKIYIDEKPFVIGNRINESQVGTTGNSDADDLLISYKGDVDAAIKDQSNWMDEYIKSKNFVQSTFDKEKEILSTLQGIKDRGGIKKETGGSLYTVDFNATPDELLDWDKPFSQQSKAVQDALIKSVENFTGRQSHKDVIEGMIKHDATGGAIYGSLDSGFGREPGDALGAIKSSEFLKSSGIKGIQYADAGSRGTAGGTKNYVVFDDNLLNILERGNADPRLLAAMGLGGAGAAMLGGNEYAGNTSVFDTPINAYIRTRNERRAGPMQLQQERMTNLAGQQVSSPQGALRQASGFAGEQLGELNRRLEGHPAYFFAPTGMEEFLNKYAYGEASPLDAAMGAFDLGLLTAPKAMAKTLNKAGR